MKGTYHPKFGSINARPGISQNMTVQDVIDFIKDQKRAKGFRFALNTGNNSDLEIDLPGNSKMMLGIAIATTADIETTGMIQLQVNNEIILDDCNVKFFTDKFTDESYYFIPRPLSGQDDISIGVKNVGTGGVFDIIFFYI